MRATMQDIPLNVARILDYGTTIHGDTTVYSWNRDELEETTFAAIGKRAAAFAHALEDELGITGDERVGTLMYNCPEHLEVLFAAACKGAVFQPLNKQLQGDQIAHIINHAEDSVIVCDPRLVNILIPILPQCPVVRAVVVIGDGDISDVLAQLPSSVAVYSYEELIDGRPTHYDWPELEEHTAAALCYSTGTSDGPPKGVAYSHRSIYLHSLSLRTQDSFAVSHGTPFLCCVPIYHVLSWGVPIAAFMSGAPLVLPGQDVSPARLARIIAEAHPRVATGVPTLWISLMVHYLHHPPARMSLTEIIAGGSPVPPSLTEMWEEKYGVDVIQMWGMTESSPVGTVARPPSGVSGQQRWEYRISQGRFPATVEYRVVTDGVEVSRTDRNHGEIQIRGPWVTGQYFHSDNVTTFRGKPFSDAEDQFTDDGWLRTGDVGRVTKDGFLTIEDRARDVIRSGGEWIYSVQLENLVMAHPDVIECAVIGYPDKKWGERPLAVTVLHEGIEPTSETAERLRASMRETLPNWMLPEYWTFVSSVDKTSVGKFDKKDLREHLARWEFEIVKLKGPGER